MPLHESGEDYLEAILMLSKDHDKVRSIDISELLGVTKASVSKAMANLERAGYVEMGKRDVRLTESGMDVAQRMLERHVFFRELLLEAGVEDERATEEACHMEHCLSAESFGRLRDFLSEHGIPAKG